MYHIIFLAPLIWVLMRSTEAQSRHLLSATNPDEELLGSLNTTQYLVQFCNAYCVGHDEKHFVPLDFLTSPECLDCHCDPTCQFYGDCCPDAEGNIVHDPDPPTCLYSWSDFDIQSKPGFGIFMVTQCSDIEPTYGAFSPVSSASNKKSYYNRDIADCNNETSYTPWTLQLDCSSGDNSGGGETTGLDLIDHLYDNEEDCDHVYTSPKHTNPRPCHPMLALPERVQKCNVTGMWTEYDEETETACESHQYPVLDGNVVYANIFCAICNGIQPWRNPKGAVTVKIPPPITVITQFFRPFKQPQSKPPTVKCKDTEWLDPVRRTCMFLHCSPGKRLEDGECVWTDDSLIGDQYTFNVLLQPDNSIATEGLMHWNTVQHMFVKNFERFMSAFRTSNYMFSVGLIEDMETVQNVVYDFPKAVLINCNFIVTNNMNRTDLETKLYNFAIGLWILTFDNSDDNVFRSMFSNIPISRVKLKANYWADPVSGTCCLPVADSFVLKTSQGKNPSRVVYVTNELYCPHVKIPKSEYETVANGWMTLKSINVSISSSDFSVDEHKKARICLDILKDIYNGSYSNGTFMDVPASFFAQQIVSLICVTLSLLCLTMTLITYCVFPALRSLPAKNNMFLMGCLFVAQLLFQFGIDKTDNQIVCAIIGVLIHFSWLCVVFWMNVCSFHMLRVFAVQNALLQPSRSKHGKTILAYCVYTFGSSAVVVIITIVVNLILSKGSEIGYGGVVCYLTSNNLVGFAFALPLSVLLAMNLTFFVVTVRAISKIENIQKHGMKERQNVYVYIKLSSLTGMFWIVAVLAEVFHQEVLVYMSIVLNGSLGVLLFLCYAANRRVYDLWKGTCDQIRKRSLDESRNITVSTSVN